MNQIAPSILSADFAALGKAVEEIEKAGIRFLHIDVMDGHFVPNITIGPEVVKALRKNSSMIFDVHLMISHPLQYAKDFAKAGADYIVFHAECEDDIAQTLAEIKSLGVKCGLSIKPNTPPQAVYPYLNQLDLVLVMTVEPGFGGQKLIEPCLEKLAPIRQKAEKLGVKPIIEIDGGVNAENIAHTAQMGAELIVAGSAVFSSANPGAEACRLCAIANEKLKIENEG
ncbi:MAG: ribulose-phosphate 3-epimerase [Oscillospiraceae bacterium]|jgi:ribulose-phosphate 3-epimerase|nr:ribulose-phosphate 3-epimerase [Oscillospiraceae bacterium]